MTIRLHNEDPAGYGFKLLTDDDQTIYKVYTFGFLDEEKREAAFAKWKARGQDVGQDVGKARQ